MHSLFFGSELAQVLTLVEREIFGIFSSLVLRVLTTITINQLQC